MTSEVLPNDLVLDILTRLPGKQVGRCKCVCKRWLSVIRSRWFRDTYRSRNSGLLLKYSSSKDPQRLRFFHCPLRRRDEPPGEFGTLTELDLLRVPGQRLRVTGLVDGLMCSYTRSKVGDERSISQLTLHNICTGENMGIPDPLTCAETLSTYYLGYDGLSGVYKLLRLIFHRAEGRDPTLRGAHIMTLRPPSGPPSTWRELADCGLPSDHINALCKAKASSDDGMLCWLRRHKSLVCFDLNKERFWFVDLPYDVKYRKKDEFRAITQFKDSLALWVSSHHSDVNVVSCYVQEEDDKGKYWRISKEFEVSEGFAFAAGISPSSFSKGEMLGMSLDDHGRVLSYSRRQMEQTDHEEEDVFFVGKLPGGDHVLATCCPFYHFKWYNSSNSELSCLAKANNLYLPLDDALGGSFV